MNLQAVVFDCDGVILESADIKTQAFAQVIEPFGPEAQQAFMHYHEGHTGVSRYEKFKWFYATILGRTITEAELTDLANLFSDICTEKVTNAPFVPGFLDFFNIAEKKFPTFVASGTPHNELIATLKTRQLFARFTGVYGSPPDKTTLLQNIIKQHNYDPQQLLMIGDGETDFKAAEQSGTHFYGRGETFSNRNCYWGHDLHDAISLLTTR